MLRKTTIWHMQYIQYIHLVIHEFCFPRWENDMELKEAIHHTFTSITQIILRLFISIWHGDGYNPQQGKILYIDHTDPVRLRETLFILLRILARRRAIGHSALMATDSPTGTDNMRRLKIKTYCTSFPPKYVLTSYVPDIPECIKASFQFIFFTFQRWTDRKLLVLKQKGHVSHALFHSPII